MEKRRPTYDIQAIKAAIGTEATLAITVKAFKDATALGFTRANVAEAVRSVTHGMFYKSMTTFADHRVWQDVYHVPFDGLMLYVKFQADAVSSFSLVSLKER